MKAREIYQPLSRSARRRLRPVRRKASEGLAGIKRSARRSAFLRRCADRLRKPPEKVIDPRDRLYRFWRQRDPSGFGPADQIALQKRSAAVAELIRDLPKDARILEVGCGVGHNLAYLHDIGYTNLEGIEISPRVVDVLRETYPQLADAPIHVGAAEDLLPTFADDSYDLVLTVAFLEHLHPDSVAVFDQMVRVGGLIVTVEADGRSSHRQYPHDIRQAFESRGAHMVRARAMSSFASLRQDQPIQSYTARRFMRMDRREVLYDFWRQPAPPGNDPHDYVGPVGRSEVLLSLISDLPRDARILEVGCNVGRNLAYLYDHGYRNLEGIEINPHAVELLRTTFPQLAGVPVHLGPAEEVLPGLHDEFDLVYTMAVLEHIHPGSTVVFDEIVRLGRSVLSIEPPGRVSHRQYPHDVPKMFQQRGLRLVSERPMADFPQTADDAGIKMFYAWRFIRTSSHGG